jgi:hypothetical protein
MAQHRYGDPVFAESTHLAFDGLLEDRSERATLRLDENVGEPAPDRFIFELLPAAGQRISAKRHCVV